MNTENTELQSGTVYDYIVVGSGSSGSIVANILSLDKNNSVLLVEAGKNDRKPKISELLKRNDPAGIPEIEWGYKSVSQPQLKGRIMDMRRAKVLGGCSSHHDLLYTRGARSDFNDWENKYGCAGWSYNDVSPYFKWIESKMILEEFCDSPFNIAYQKAVLDLGYPCNPNHNSGATHYGVSPAQCSINKKTGNRESTYDSFIRPVLKSRPNLHVASGALTKRVVIDTSTKTAYGVRIEQFGKEFTINAAKEIHLCAGVFGSPQILMLSGIGDASALSRLGISVNSDLPGVGKNLQDHLQLSTLFSSPQAITEQDGFITSGDMSPDDKARIAITMGRGKHTYGQSPSDLENYYSVFVYMQGTQSLGTVSLQSNDISSPPVIDPRYLSHPADMDLCRKGLTMALAIGNAPGLSPWRKRQIKPDPLSDFNEYILNNLQSSHPVGTCKMGMDDMSVVDPSLKVRGISGLRVIDASIMPRIVHANTASTAMMIGVKGAVMAFPEAESVLKKQL